jgi:hypothetical protein
MVFMNYFHYHRWILGDTYGYVRTRNPDFTGAIITKLAGLLSYQGWLAVFPFFVFCVFGRAWKGRLSSLLLLIAVYASQLLIPNYRLVDKSIFVIGLTAGLLITIRMAIPVTGYATTEFPQQFRGNARHSDPEVFLGLWYFAIAACCVFLFTEGSARYILSLVPPAILIFFRDLEAREIPEYRLPFRPIFSTSMLASGSIVLSLAWGLLLSQADLEFASIYPRAAQEFKSSANGIPSYYGGEWGFRYYMQQAGSAQLPIDEFRVEGGSYIALPALALAYEIPPGLRSMTAELQTFTYGYASPIRLLDRQSHAGFYSTGWGLLPFGLSRSSLESIEVRQVNYLAERLPYASVQTQGEVLPWPGYASIQGQRVLSLMVKPGTCVSYPWTFRNPVSFYVSCGIPSAAGFQGAGEFEIRQLDASGKVLCAATNRSVEADKWTDLSLWLEPVPGNLELRYSSTPGMEWTGAFAGPVMRPAKAERGLK